MGGEAEVIMSSTVLPGQKQFTASVWLVSTGNPPKAALVHHKKLDRWMQPGGHIEDDENPIVAAVREVREETGVDISQYLVIGKKFAEESFFLPTPDFMMQQLIPEHNGVPAHFHIDVEYVVKVPEQILRMQERESHAIGWFSEAEIAELDVFENTRSILQKIFAETRG